MKFTLTDKTIKTLQRGDLIQSTEFDYILVVLENNDSTIATMGLTNPKEIVNSHKSFTKSEDKHRYIGTLHNGIKIIK